jgi:hypothetical protein
MTAAGTPDHDLLHSGSRWEPAAGAVPPPAGPGTPPPAAPPRTTRGRKVLVAAAGVGCLLLGGVGGWAIGHAAGGSGSGGPTPAGFSGGTGNGAPGDGGPGDGDGGFRHHGLPGTGRQDGTGSTGGTA